MRLLVVLAIIFLILNLGIWGLYFFGNNLMKIPEIPALPKELTFEKPQAQMKVDLPIHAGETAVLIKKGKTRGLDAAETMVVTKDSASQVYHLMIFDQQKAMLYELKNALAAPEKILLQTFEGDGHLSFYLNFGENTPGYYLRWNGYQYVVPENEKDLSAM